MVVAVVCFGLGMMVGNVTHRHPAPIQIKPTETPHPLFTPEAATLAQQKMCDEQAAKRFNEDKSSDEFREERRRNPPVTADYTSHYDSEVNVCYVRLHSVYANPPIVSAVVYDAFGGRIFATYSWINSQGKKFWEVSPTECKIDIPGKSQETCTSSETFDKLTEKYFGVTP